MSNQKRKNISINNKLRSMVMLLIIVLATLIVFVGAVLLFMSYSDTVHDELSSVTNILMDCVDLSVRGDYSCEDSVLMKGGTVVMDSTMLYRIKEASDIDTTIFWHDTRIITTVQDNYGISAVGTKANKDVVDMVLNQGREYFSRNIDINGVSYIGYYIPIRNSDDSIVGMMFAGKQRSFAYSKIGKIAIWFVLFSLIASLIALSTSRVFSNKMVADISMINGFLKTISEGDLEAEIAEDIVSRNDELGSIGLYATRMKEELKKMIETDPLTALYNRRSCNNILHNLEEDKVDYSIVMCDIDWFKKINDSYGHDAGDYVLVTMSELLRENIKDCGYASRWGGEEFLLVYRLGIEDTIEKVEQLQTRIREYEFSYGEAAMKVTMTFGIEAESKKGTYENRIKRADKNLYIGKQGGRDRIVS